MKMEKGEMKMEYINLQVVDWLPLSVAGLTVKNDDGGFTVLLNSKMSYHRQKETYLHETMHIVSGDFEADIEKQVSKLEKDRHERFSNI